MTNNWEKPDWPNFTWNPSRLTAAENKFLTGAGVVLGAVKHLDEGEHDRLLVEVMSVEALKTSAIEGEILNRASVQSSILRQFGLASPDKHRILPAEQQQKALLRLLREGPEGFEGGLSAGNYSAITGASPATTTRDLADLVEQGALLRTGERKHARYTLNLSVGSFPGPQTEGAPHLASL